MFTRKVLLTRNVCGYVVLPGGFGTLDEIFDALDESGIESVIELLQELSQEKSSIFVISHNPHLQSMFSNTITVVKKDGFSTILEGCDESEDEEE